MDQNQERMATTPRWEAKDVRRLARIVGAVGLIVTTWSVVVLPHVGATPPAAPSQAPASKVLPAPEPASAPLYWIRMINTPDDGSEPAWALWMTPTYPPPGDQVQFEPR